MLPLGFPYRNLCSALYLPWTEPRAPSQPPSVLPDSFLRSDSFRPTGNTETLGNKRSAQDFGGTSSQRQDVFPYRAQFLPVLHAHIRTWQEPRATSVQGLPTKQALFRSKGHSWVPLPLPVKWVSQQ